MLKAVILDLDDTLCMTEAACWKLENRSLAAIGRRPIPRELHKQTWGKPLFEVIAVRSPGVNVDEFRRAYKPLIKQMVASGDLDSIPPENLSAIDALLGLGKDVLVLTSREHSELQHMLEPGHDLSTRVKAFYYKDNMQYHKPDPRAFTHIQEDHGWLPEECAYVGDSVSDADAALGAGLRFVASLESGLRTKSDFSGHQVDAFIDSFPQIVSVIRELDRQ